MLPEETLEREVAAIGALTRDELTARWQKAYGCLPPKGINRVLLERAAAWHLQAARQGGLSTAARAILRVGSRLSSRSSRSTKEQDVAGVSRQASVVGIERDADRAARRVSRRVSAAAPPAVGTRLMREWNGRMYVVDVTEQGVLFDGKIYRSLSSVAKRITGAHWSGPRFFGL
ncbi:DUF2924 domain-containing protein [Nitratireductor mangrovi]|uniref:DUF2924 domain-containing protein n=1 Tax=Nitratireductor mangrovi TaxID=2599600 RepID=A0A6H0DZY5_9HYPH|nr:DUF2924 domain-containing protein [Nitratireductor mangrovi]QIS94697.1 DUF2924 domain-containing protein [Nitratireductor mangrovi]